MRITRTVEEIRSAVEAARSEGRAVSLVPTMGFLHEGHLSLVRIAREKAERDGCRPFVVMSIFVNPAQFGPNEDYETYPRDEERDVALAEREGVDVIFAPDAETMYPSGFRSEVRVTGLTQGLCGRGRPGHFDGVALVVSKLLNIVRPDYSVFGQKDAQQAVVVRRLAADLNLPGSVVLGPIVREADGVAMSSRNAYLSAEERAAARAIPRGLQAAADAFAGGERSAAVLAGRVRREVEAEPGLAVEYVEVVRADDLAEWEGKGVALLAAAVHAGKTRLIDNVTLGEESPPHRAGVARAGERSRRTKEIHG